MKRLSLLPLFLLACTGTTPPEDTSNMAPIADAGQDQLVFSGQPVTLSGTAADADGRVSMTTWEQVLGPDVVLATELGLTTSFTAPTVSEPTVLSFALSILDNDGAPDRSTVAVVVQPDLSAPPTVDAGDDQVVPRGSTVTLAGSASDNGTVDSLAWHQLSGPAVALSDSTAADPSFTVPSVSETTSLVFSLTATDDDGLQSDDSVAIVVTVDEDVNQPPTVDGGVAQQVAAADPVTLSATAADVDGTVASTSWTQLLGPAVTLTDAQSLTSSFTAPDQQTASTLVFEVTVTDDDGATASDVAIVEVAASPDGNQPPTVDAGADRTVVSEETGSLAGTVSDSDGTLVRVEWTQLSGPTITLADPSDPTTSFTAPQVTDPETVELQLEAEDDEGAVASDVLVVSVLPVVHTNQPPEVFAGTHQAQPNGSFTQLGGTASDPDGSIVSTTWTQIDGPHVVLDDADTLDPSFTAPVVGCAVALVFELLAVDDHGGQTTDRVTVTVEGTSTEMLSLPVWLNLEADAGGLITEGDTWEWGAFTSGPERSWDGANGWATHLDGNAPPNVDTALCLPSIDRAGAGAAVLSFRLYSDASNGDATHVEALGTDGWAHLGDVVPAYDRTSLAGWGRQGVVPKFTLATVAIPDEIPDPVRLRIVYHSNSINNGEGTYVDEIRVDLEASDPDADGLFGIRGELHTPGTDPFLADTDGDGVDDPTEVADGTDPLDLSDFVGEPMLTPPFLLDFEADDGGLIPDGGWQRGTPSAGNSSAHSGVNVWGNDLNGIYGPNERTWLYLPDIDLAATTDPTLSMRLWSRIANGDALSFQIHDTATETWTVIDPLTPHYGTSDPLGQAGFANLGRAELYDLVLFDLAPWAGEEVRVRVSLHTDSLSSAQGVYIDDIAVNDESEDPDGDGLFGIASEYLVAGTDPFVADTDGDGESDGSEEDAGRNPLNPADHSAALAMLPGDHLDFETGPEGAAGTESWAWGTIASGPRRSWDGSVGWATNLTGLEGTDRRSALYLPPLDLQTAVDPVLSFRFWAEHANGDGTAVQLYEPHARAWTTLTPAILPYDTTTAEGPGWKGVGYLDGYDLTLFSLEPWIGALVRVRILATSDGLQNNDGAYVDEVRLDEEASDPDSDGHVGVLSEWMLGADPYLSDTDGDGEDDGSEIDGGTDPANPASHHAEVTWGVGTVETFDLQDGGVAGRGDLWEFGSPGQGPLAGFTGDRAWATGLTFRTTHHMREALYLPPIDLAGATSPTLLMHAWMDLFDDSLTVEAYDDLLGWQHISTVAPAYGVNDVLGFGAWRDPGPDHQWTTLAVDLSAWVDERVALRLVFRANGVFISDGAFLDDFVIAEEAVDYDGDGLHGVFDERATYGTDPTVADTDGDGVNDGDEVSGGSDPLDASSVP